MSVYLGIETKESLALKLQDPFHEQGFQIETLRREAFDFLNQEEMTRAAVLDTRMRESVTQEEAFCYSKQGTA
jgi:hypothetical protein